jgi:predicted transcriptional regulator
MKVAISIPDEVFRDAETLGQELNISRSRLYARAVSEYVARHAPDSVTESLDRLCAQLNEPVDPWASTAARRVMERTEWK